MVHDVELGLGPTDTSLLIVRWFSFSLSLIRLSICSLLGSTCNWLWMFDMWICFDYHRLLAEGWCGCLLIPSLFLMFFIWNSVISLLIMPGWLIRSEHAHNTNSCISFRICHQRAISFWAVIPLVPIFLLWWWENNFSSCCVDMGH